jgi:hypothetical protein
MAIFDDAGANDLGSFSGGIHTPRTPFMDTLMADGIKVLLWHVPSHLPGLVLPSA